MECDLMDPTAGPGGDVYHDRLDESKHADRSTGCYDALGKRCTCAGAFYRHLRIAGCGRVDTACIIKDSAEANAMGGYRHCGHHVTGYGLSYIQGRAATYHHNYRVGPGGCICSLGQV